MCVSVAVAVLLLLCPYSAAGLGHPRQMTELGLREQIAELGHPKQMLVQKSSANAGDGVDIETSEIDLDLPPFQRWQEFAGKQRQEIIGKCQGMGELFARSLGPDLVQRWMQATHLEPELREEFEGIVAAVNHSAVTLDCLMLTDMWQAVDSPSFECTGMLMAMANGTVLHGRNADYDLLKTMKQALKTGVRSMSAKLVNIVLLQGGQPIAEMIVQAGSLGTHTGMRFGSYSVNSNARLHHEDVQGNLLAAEAGGLNFPWVLRLTLQKVSNFKAAVSTIEKVPLNAPNYFIFAGAGPYEGAVVTKDRLGSPNPLTPPTQRLDAAKGVWYLVQTNDDLLQPPEDARRGAALVRLAASAQTEVSMDFVQREMLTSPIKNSDTLFTWVANPAAGTYQMVSQPGELVLRGMVSKAVHHALRIPMPQDLRHSH